MRKIISNDQKNIDRTALVFYLTELRKGSLLSRENEKELFARIDKGETAVKEVVIKANLRLVVSIARRYTFSNELSLEDLIQEGNIGLMRAVDRFDHTRGFRFSSYASWWIKQAILSALTDTSRMIRIPVNKLQELNYVSQRIRDLEAENSNKLKSKKELEIYKAQYQQLQQIPASISLETQIGEDQTIGHTIRDQKVDFVSDTERKDLFEIIVTHMKAILSAQEFMLIDHYYGIGTFSKSFEQIADITGKSKENIKQNTIKIIRKLRTSELEKLIG